MHGIKQFGIAALLGLLIAGTAHAEQEGGGPNPGITVQGTGEAKGKPAQVEIACALSGDAELASDATVKFRDAKKRAIAAIENLKNPNLKIESDGIAIGGLTDASTQMMIMQGRMDASQAAKPRIQIAEKSRLILSNVDKLDTDAMLDTVLKILDVAKEGGFQVGLTKQTDDDEIQNYQMYIYRMMNRSDGTSVVNFKLADGTDLRDQAYKAALADAKTKAEKLAELAGVKLGKIVAIDETAGLQKFQDTSVTGNTAGELTKRINLTVQFEIAK